MQTPSLEKFSITKTLIDKTSPQACDFIALHSGLPKARIKDAMNKGAVWLTRKGQGRIRLRKATYLIQKGDMLELHYDPKVLSTKPPLASILADFTHYSVWIKPARLLTQGTDYGDHASLLRQVETFFNPRREAYPVHRLDREAAGLILVAHSGEAAAKLSKLLQDHKVIKRYRAEVSGLPEKAEGIIDEPLDGKEAMTRYRVTSRHPDTNTATVLIEIDTGRLHQIRRHLAGIGHPVMGDPRYGSGNKDGKPMRLTACELEWICPFTGKRNQSSI
jgi:tRNA pseudouridine32 synthase/23S rRNA pseudouridine746 synthase